MNIIISPAKRMQEDYDSLPFGGLPRFPEKTQMLWEHLRGLSPEALRELLAGFEQDGETPVLEK